MAPCAICNEDEYYKIDNKLCNKCFNKASRVISSMAKLWESETVDLACSKRQKLEAAFQGIGLLEPYLAFATQYTAAFTDQVHTDILLKPGRDDGPLIPAHRALLAVMSNVFKNMLDSDICKAPPKTDEIITFPEMNHEELKTFLQFLYNGKLSKEEQYKHASSLFSAARKYEIRFLEKFLEHEMVRNLEVNNVLEVLEIAGTCYNRVLMHDALQFITANASLVLSPEFENFASKNPSLALEVSRALARVLRRRPY